MSLLTALTAGKLEIHLSCLQIYQPRYVLPPQVPGQLPQMSSPYPGAQVYMPMQPHMSVGPVGQNVPMAYYPMGAVYPPGSTVMVDGGFDAGARFTAGSGVNIPVSTQLGITAVSLFHLLRSDGCVFRLADLAFCSLLWCK